MIGVELIWIVLAAIAILGIAFVLVPRVPSHLKRYTKDPGRLPVRNDARFFREQDDDPRYLEREEDGRP